MNGLNDLIEAVRQSDADRVATLLDANDALARQRDKTGATPLHYAVLAGQREIAQLLIARGADINSSDGEFGATPAGWAIEYLRELGGHLGIELDDLAFAIAQEDVRWVARFLKRFPMLRQARYKGGKTFRQLAQESGNEEIAGLFGPENAA